MENSSPDFFKNLSPEEIQSLMGMFNKVMSAPVNPEQVEKQAFEESSKQYAGLFESDQSLLDSPVELVFVLTCNVLNKNQKGEIENTEKVLVKNYHVPLNNKQEVERYIEGFFNKFHDKMEQQANEMYPEENKEEKKDE